MPAEPSKYAENQFEVATRSRDALMSEVSFDVKPRIAAAAAAHPGLVPIRDVLLSLDAAWSGAESAVANAGAGQISATFAFHDKLTSLTRKPDADTNSPLDIWDLTIGGQVAFGGATYLYLLPHGRETLTLGSYEQRLDAIRDFGLRLAQQTAKPVLVALGTTVTTFYNQAHALRDFQATRKTALDNARVDQEAMRLLLAAGLYKMVGDGIGVWSATPLMVDTLFDVNMLRNPAQTIPAPPADTAWGARHAHPLHHRAAHRRHPHRGMARRPRRHARAARRGRDRCAEHHDPRHDHLRPRRPLPALARGEEQQGHQRARAEAELAGGVSALSCGNEE